VGENTVLRVAASLANSSFAASVLEAFRARMRVVADRTIAEQIGKIKIVLRGRDKSSAADLERQVSAVIDYASPKANLEWQNALGQTGKSGLIARLRK
jgi:hypothetical protein